MRRSSEKSRKFPKKNILQEMARLIQQFLQQCRAT